jgi:hypothetical protein
MERLRPTHMDVGSADKRMERLRPGVEQKPHFSRVLGGYIGQTGMLNCAPKPLL